MFDSVQKKWKQKVNTLVHLCSKVLSYRCDVLSAEQVSRVESLKRQLNESLGAFLKGNLPEKDLDAVYQQVDAALKEVGGRIYPLNFWNENAEIFLVAAILMISIRVFFFQPFRIPTGSMFPSFSGMQTKVYSKEKAAPRWFTKPFRWLIHGAENYHYQAPCDGQIYLPLFHRNEAIRYNSFLKYEIEYGREIGPVWVTWLLPKPYRVYLIYVGEKQVRVRVPFEFHDMEAMLRKKFFPRYEKISEVLSSGSDAIVYKDKVGLCLKTDVFVKSGESCLHFDIFAGDMLFVDRISYHFRKPKIGEPVVFFTAGIEAIGKEEYYIKRLVGQANDILYINSQDVLCRNGEPITGSLAFEGNNCRLGLYPGYRSIGSLKRGLTVFVPKHSFFVLGDNSPFSFDSRYWGFVPEKMVIGKAAFVVHPWSWRWGVSEKDKSNIGAKADDYVFQ